MTPMNVRDGIIADLTGPEGPFRLTDAVVDGHRQRVYADLPGSMRDLIAGSAAHGDREYLVYEGTRITYARHLELVAGLARWLAGDRGVHKGDRVAIACRNYPEWIIAFWATQVLGAIAVTLNAWWNVPELAFAIKDSGSTVLIVDGERLALLEATTLAQLEMRAVLVARPDGPPPPDVTDLQAVLASVPKGCVLPEAEVDRYDDSTIMYTSGTTGQPKGAVLTHLNHLVNLTNMKVIATTNLVLSGTMPQAPGAQVSAMIVGPLFHIAGLTSLYAFTDVGAKVTIIRKWDTDVVIEIMSREGVNTLNMVPALVRRLLEALDRQPRALPSLVSIGSGGAPVPPDLPRTVDELFRSGVSMTNGWGLTETSCSVALIVGKEYLERPDSVGKPVPTAEIRAIDPESGEPLPPGKIGELVVRGPNLVRGYWNRPRETRAAFRHGWFRTGDLGRLDEEGYVYVVDRLKDVVIRGGENVYCVEVEAMLLQHPDVADAAVVGIPNPTVGEEVGAVVQLSEGAAVDQHDLRVHLGERLASFKVPTRFVFVTADLPRTATGKVLKRGLRNLFSD